MTNDKSTPTIPESELQPFLRMLNYSQLVDGVAVNAAADLDILIEAGVLDPDFVYEAIFEDGPEADAVVVPGSTATAELGQWLVARIQAIRADLPAYVDFYMRDETGALHPTSSADRKSVV